MGYSALLTDTITVATPLGVDSSGDSTFNTAATMRARVEYGTKLIYGANGTQAQCEAILCTETEIPMNSRIWLPGATTTDVNQAKRPIVIKKASTPGSALTIYETYL